MASYGAAGFAEYGLHANASVSAAVAGGAAGSKSSKSEEMAWEKQYERSTWDAIEEDPETGTLINRAQRRARGVAGADGESAPVQRGMMRHVFLILDMSRGMESNDLKPSRAAATVELATAFVVEFFDTNPISSLGVIIAANGVATKVSELSGNPKRHVDAIAAHCKTTGGDLSFQHCLETAARTLMLVPPYGTREVVLVHGAHASCDPGSVEDAIAETAAALVRATVISLPGEVYIATRIARETGGAYSVPENYEAFRAALMACCRPPPRRPGEEGPRSAMMHMGFPTLVMETPGLCACHALLRPRGYVCPRCDARSCEVPTVCPVCALQLVSAPSLARSYHHLFPVPVFVEVPRAGGRGELRLAEGDEGAGDGTIPPATTEHMVVEGSLLDGPPGPRVELVGDASSRCTACAFALPSEEARYVCPRCRHAFCHDCDAVIHETLHNCPTCVGLRE